MAAATCGVVGRRGGATRTRVERATTALAAHQGILGQTTVAGEASEARLKRLAVLDQTSVAEAPRRGPLDEAVDGIDVAGRREAGVPRPRAAPLTTVNGLRTPVEATRRGRRTGLATRASGLGRPHGPTTTRLRAVGRPDEASGPSTEDRVPTVGPLASLPIPLAPSLASARQALRQTRVGIPAAPSAEGVARSSAAEIHRESRTV